MVLTRLSHIGEVCPLSDHSYSDSATHSSSCSSSQANNCKTVSTTSKSIEQPEEKEEEEIIKVELNILDFPNEILERIFTYFPYKNIGDIRKVCKRFEAIGSSILNSSFLRLQAQILTRFQNTKSQMPRRESARRKHPLARESDILETLHMRLSLLHMSFGKHIERKHCCFFAGEILDEVCRIMHHVESTPNLGRAYKVTDELCDLCTMAMEHFKENIEPRLPEITCLSTDFLDGTSPYQDGSSGRSSIDSGFVSEPDDDMIEREPPPSSMVLRKSMKRIKQGMKRYNTQLTSLKRELKNCKSTVNEQQKQMNEYVIRLEGYDQKFEESSRKFNLLFQELNKCKTDLQYLRSKSPGHGSCYNCDRTFKYEEMDDNSEQSTPMLPQKTPSLQGACATSPSTVRNLETVFKCIQLKTEKHDLELGVASTSNVSKRQAEHSTNGGLSEREDVDKRQSSEDDEVGGDDTVGKRVRERKRIKLDYE